MKRLLLLIAVTSLALGSSLAAEKTKTTSVKGEILDLACYMGSGAKGEGHAGCAAKCLKGGQPMGLLGADGAVYLLMAGHDDAAAFEKAKDLAGKQVEVTGEMATKGTLKGITVHEVKAL